MYDSNGNGITALKQKINDVTNRDVYRAIPKSEAGSVRGGVNRGIGLGLFMNNEHLFGLGEREDTLELKRTTNDSPYELWAFDNPHQPNKKDSLYGNMPYVHGIGEKSSSAITWVNSAHTWAFLDD